MREYRNRICSAVLAAVCVIGTALIPSRAVHAEDVVDPIAVQKQAAYDAVPETNGWKTGRRDRMYMQIRRLLWR